MSAISPLDQSLVSDLRTTISGDVIVPGDDAYYSARAVWNGRIDRFPAAVVRVSSTDDVATAVEFAREQDLQIAVRSSGHHVTGSAVVDDGLVIDLSNLTEIDVFAPHGLPHSYITEKETRWLMFVHEPGLEQLWASVGSPADSWTIPDASKVEEQMNRVAKQIEQYGIEIVGDPFTADEHSSQ